jgi:hypothetical protein
MYKKYMLFVPFLASAGIKIAYFEAERTYPLLKKCSEILYNINNTKEGVT